MYNISYSHMGNFDVLENKMIINIQSVDYQNRKQPITEVDLLIDTGAFITMMNKKTADTNGYPITTVQGCAVSGFSQQGLLCDLRKIPIMIFCGFTIKDVLVATPHYDNVMVSEVLGMNVLENFDIGLEQTKGEIYLNKRASFVSEKPKYRSGAVSLLTETSLDEKLVIIYEGNDILIRTMKETDIDFFTEKFLDLGWGDRKESLSLYFTEQENNVRDVLVAVHDGVPAGYITLIPNAPNGAFANKGLPEIKDFNVLTTHRRHGIGNLLMQHIEAIAKTKSKYITLGVGLYTDYGTAQRMYVKRVGIFPTVQVYGTATKI